MQYKIERDLLDNWDITAIHDDGSTTGLNGGEPCETLVQLADFVDELESGNCLSPEIIDDLRGQIDREAMSEPEADDNETWTISYGSTKIGTAVIK